MSGKKTGDPKGYAEAMEELEQIVRELDSRNVDVDVLSDRVKRAMELIEWCDERISAAELTVSEIAATIGLSDDVDDEDDDEEEEDEEDEEEDDEDD